MASSTGEPALTITRLVRGRSIGATHEWPSKLGRNWPSPLRSEIILSVRIGVRLYTATDTPRDATFRARFWPITARPNTPKVARVTTASVIKSSGEPGQGSGVSRRDGRNG